MTRPGITSKRDKGHVIIDWDAGQQKVLVLRDGVAPLVPLLTPEQKSQIRNAVCRWRQDPKRTPEQKDAGERYLEESGIGLPWYARVDEEKD